MTKSKFFTSLYSFVIGLKVNLVGQLWGSEILALLFMPFGLKKSFRSFPLLSKVLMYYLVLLIALIFSDFYNGSESSDYLRGWASIIFSFISLIFLVKSFAQSNINIIYFLFFYAITIVVFGEGVEVKGLENDNYFKTNVVGILNPLVLIVIYFLAKKDKLKAVLVFMFLYGLINIIFDARSNSLSYFLAILFLLPKIYKFKITASRLILPSILMLTISYGLYVYYVNEVLSGKVGGANAKQLSLTKNPYNPFELLYVGRAGTFVSLEAIMEKPIVGHGSWAKDTTGKYTALGDEIMGTNTTVFDNEYIPSHSIIITAWLWAGIFGFVAILKLTILLIKSFSLIYKNETRIYYLIIITILFIDMIWNFLFSPMGHLRLTIPQVAALLIVFSRQVQKINLISNNSKIK